jgi:cytochrome bd-type quinol oxidase subunit 1
MAGVVVIIRTTIIEAKVATRIIIANNTSRTTSKASIKAIYNHNIAILACMVVLLQILKLNMLEVAEEVQPIKTIKMEGIKEEEDVAEIEVIIEVIKTKATEDATQINQMESQT